MPWGLKRYYGTGALHFITWSCYRRQPSLGNPARRDLLLDVIESMRKRYRFGIVGYVVMPEHVHLLISEPQVRNPSTVVQAVKLSFVRRVVDLYNSEKPYFSHTTREMGHPTFTDPASPIRFWQRRFYDFNVWSQRKEIEKLKYMHRNPVVRGLVEEPDQWRWSSYRWYALGEVGIICVNDWSWWEDRIRFSTRENPHVSQKPRDMGHPIA